MISPSLSGTAITHSPYGDSSFGLRAAASDTVGSVRKIRNAPGQSAESPNQRSERSRLLDGRAGTIVDELELSPEALAFLLGAPPLAGSRETSDSAKDASKFASMSSDAAQNRLGSSGDDYSTKTDEQLSEVSQEMPSAFPEDADDGGSSSGVRGDEDGELRGAGQDRVSKKPDEKNKPDEKAEGPTQLAPEEQELVERLAERDREVRTHEQAHVNAAGPYARGGPTYTYQKGPDGNRYAIGGEVQIDTSPVPNDPEATIRKAQIVRAAALAPAEPSSQDKAVASAATKMQQQAQSELIQMRMAQATGEEENDTGSATAKLELEGRGESPETPAFPQGQDENIKTSDSSDPSSDDSDSAEGNMPSPDISESAQGPSYGSNGLERAATYRTEQPGSSPSEPGLESENTPTIQRKLPTTQHNLAVISANPTSSSSLLDVRW